MRTGLFPVLRKFRGIADAARDAWGAVCAADADALGRAVSGEYLLTKLTARFEDRPLPEVSVVDLREELKAGNRSILSRKLKGSLEKRLRNNEQSILFLNRRGYAGFVSCRLHTHRRRRNHRIR